MAAGLGAGSLAAKFKAGDGLEGYLGRWLLLEAAGGDVERAAGCPWGVPWGRGARVEVRRALGLGGVVPMAAGGIGPSCLHCIIFFCSGVFCQGFRRGKGFRSGCRLLLGNTMGWLCGTTTSTSAADEDLDEEEMGLVRTEGLDLSLDLSPLGCSSAAEVQSFI